MASSIDGTELIFSHPALGMDLEYVVLLPDPALRPLHLSREKQRVQQTLDEGGWGYSSAHGITLVRSLSFDTSLFGFPCADLTRFYLQDTAPDRDIAELLDTTLDGCRDRGITLLSARIPAYHIPLIHLLQQRSFQLVDTSIELGGKLPLPYFLPPTDFCVRSATKDDREPLASIAATFELNRFHWDERIPRQKAKEVYTSWVAAAAEGRHGQLLVIEVDGQVAGFATFVPADEEVKVGIVGLVVIHPSFRGQRLLDPLLAACAQQIEGRACVTSTQVSNISALRAFIRNGLLPIGARHVFHRWL